MNFLWSRKLISVIFELCRAHCKLKLFICRDILMVVFHLLYSRQAVLSFFLSCSSSDFLYSSAIAFGFLLTRGGGSVLCITRWSCPILVNEYKVVDYVFKVDCLAGSLPWQILEGHVTLNILTRESV